MAISLMVLAIIAFLFYYLFIRGSGYVILFFIFGIFGGKMLILNYFPSSSKTVLTFASYNMCYATFIAALISLLAIGFLMEMTSK